MTETLTRWPLTEPAPGHLAWEAEPRGEIDNVLVCSEVSQVTHDVKSFVLQPTLPQHFCFDPGQHLMVTVTVDGDEITRCYTIASSPWRSDALTITVKRVPDGPVSNWLHDNLRPGDTLPVTGPAGDFSTARHPADRYLFLSAGSGITPLMSMTRTMRDRGRDADVVFVHCARSPEDIIFRAELDEIAGEDPGIRVAVVCEQDSAGERWTGRRGRLTGPMLRAIAPDLAEREIFTCGPPPYMKAVRGILASAGAVPARCHEETFTFPGTDTERTQSPGPRRPAPAGDAGGASSPAPAATFTVEFSRSGRTIECAEGTTVLEAAARAGLSLPSSCGEGLCGTCKSTMRSGSVDMNHAGGIRRREINENKILLCCSTPRESLVIDA